jgi:hypothetical protein
VTLSQAALDRIAADIEAQTAALPPPTDERVASLAALIARVDIRLARESAELEADSVRASRPQGAERGRGARTTTRRS